MATQPTIMSIDEFLDKYGNKAFEAFVRQKNGKYRAFSKIIIKDDNREAVKEIKNAIENITKTVSDINKTTIDVTNSLKLSNALSAFNAAAGVVNMCATVAGFAIIHTEMRKMEDGIKDVAKKMLDAHEQETFYKFDLMIDDYKDMLDCKKIDVEYSEEKYRTLISNEHAILKLLISIFTNETCNNRNDILYAIMSLSSMLACTLTDYDEIYYYNHKEKQKWHSNHDTWMEVYDVITSERFVECLQDFLFIECNYNQYQTDLFTVSVIDNFKEAKQAVVDRQTLIELKDTKEQYNDLMSYINQSVINDINNSIEEIGLSENVQVQNLVQETAKTLELYS